MIEQVRKKVFELLNNDTSGHGIDYIERVLNLSLEFAKKRKCEPRSCLFNCFTT